MATNGKANGTGAMIATEGHEPEEASSEPPAVVAELSASCARFVNAKYRVPLDGTSDTLSLVDQYVRDARAELVAKPETLPLLQATIGAYLGEVMRRAFGANWRVDGEQPDWRLEMTNVYLAFNPIGMVREALLREESEGWHAHLETEEAEREELARRIEMLPEVSEDEFYAPTTRFDMVALAVEALRAKMVEEGHADVTFSSDDYRKP